MINQGAQKYMEAKQKSKFAKIEVAFEEEILGSIVVEIFTELYPEIG